MTTTDAPIPMINTVLVQRACSVPASQIAQTGTGVPNIIIRALRPWMVVCIRASRVFMQTLAAGVTVTSISHMATFKTAVIFAAASAGMAAIQNSAELLVKLDESYPEIRG